MSWLTSMSQFGRARDRLYSLLLAAAALAAAAATAAAAAPPTSTVPLAPQSGQAAYTHNCVQCHGDTLEGGEFGPPLKGAQFEAHWQSQPSEALLQYIATKMPPAGPGSLSTQMYADIEAYLRQANDGMSAGGSANHGRTVRAVIHD